MENVTDSCKTVETGVDPRLHTLFRADAHEIIYPVENREVKNHTLSRGRIGPYPVWDSITVRPGRLYFQR